MEERRDARFKDWRTEPGAPVVELAKLSDRPAIGARRRRHGSPRLDGDLDHVSVAPMTEQTPLVDSADLMRGGRLLSIRHNGAVYTLRITRQDKLLLTK